MISRIVINFKAVIINLYLSVEAFVDQATWLADGARIQKESFALHSSIWDMQVTIETDVCINLLRPQILRWPNPAPPWVRRTAAPYSDRKSVV